jgi:hypothetical protein
MGHKFDVVVSPVREVSLVGYADLNHWRGKLAVHGLHPTEADGSAEMLLVACEGRFMGVRFRELSVSVFVAREAGSRGRDGVLLLRAFNSIRFAAFVERTMFHTPYYPQRVAVSPDVPAFVRLGRETDPILFASMADDESASDRLSVAASDGWQGPIYLPDLRDAAVGAERLFYGSLTGDTRSAAFDATRDTFRLGAKASDPIVPLLAEARFKPTQWILRACATHGKSKTIRRVAGEDFAGSADGRMLA